MKKFSAITLLFVFFLISMGSYKKQPSYFNQSEPVYGIDYENASQTETIKYNINYDYKDDQATLMNMTVPKYDNGTSNTMMCAVIAGADIIGYYDATLENLISNYVPYRNVAGTKQWKYDYTYITPLLENLHSLMGTSSTGTSYEGFKIGLSSYSVQKGYTVTYSEMGKNFISAQSFIRSNRPIALFMLGAFNFIGENGINEKNKQDDYLTYYFAGNHVSVCYGYRTITYYDAVGTVLLTKRFFKVATGILTMPYGWVDIDDHTQIEHLLGVDIR